MSSEPAGWRRSGRPARTSRRSGSYGTPIYSLTRSQRWADLHRDPRVAVVIDAGEKYDELRGVEIEGEAAAVGPVPRTGGEALGSPGTSGTLGLARAERLMARKYRGSEEMVHDGRHAWLRITPRKIVSWDFRKLADLPPRGPANREPRGPAEHEHVPSSKQVQSKPEAGPEQLEMG
jgi:hypothetical protein